MSSINFAEPLMGAVWILPEKERPMRIRQMEEDKD
jgi:hypothetical protein